MDKKELRKLSKNELIALFLTEREARLELEKRLEKVEHLLSFREQLFNLYFHLANPREEHS